MLINKMFSRIERHKKFSSYKEFIKSIWWIKQKEFWYSKHKKRCARCRDTKYINLHHMRYPKGNRFLMMEDGDFVALCRKCHKKYHSIHGVQGSMKRTTARFVKELGLAGKK